MESPSESCLKSRNLERMSHLDTTRVLEYISATLGRAGLIRGAIGALSAAAFNVADGFLSTAFSGAQGISFARRCYAAYLLMQPDSAEWLR